eukprot:4773919-Pyramimonas_sp.AAC.1
MKQAQRVLLAYKSPYHQGVSFHAKLAFCGDPAWRAGVAPALQWAHIVWTALTSPSTSHYNIKELCQMWNIIPRGEGLSWKSSREPIQRMHLSLNRIGWQYVSALTWADDFNRVVHLGFNTLPRGSVTSVGDPEASREGLG